MKIILGLGVILIFRSMASAAPIVCEPITNLWQLDLFIGSLELYSRLEKGIETKPDDGYFTLIDLPDLTICKEVASGVLYRYKWNTIVYKTMCDPNVKCDPKKEKKTTEHKNCAFTYLVKPEDKDFDFVFTGPKCS